MARPIYFTSGDAPGLHSSQPSSSHGPPSNIILEYLNEGGANFVFRIRPEDDSTILPDHLQGQLLRLRKDLPHVQGARDQLSAFDDHFKPLFPPQNLIQHTPIQLHGDFPIAMNASIKELDRPSHRLQDFLPESEAHGLLVTDMTPAPGDILLQVKPKWLVQSPSAPSNSKRCRTCALRAHRASSNVRTATDAQESCPLELISDEESDRRRAVQKIADDQRLQDYLVNDAQPLLHILRDNQAKLDKKGVLGASSESEILELCKAMTVRDCTLFLKLSGGKIDARLADLDLKQPEKLSRWKKVELDLIDHGWYTNAEEKRFWVEEKVCLLSRGSK